MSITATNNQVFDATPATAADQSVEKKRGLFAKVGDGCWYAIPPGMADSFRKAGAEVLQADALPR